MDLHDLHSLIAGAKPAFSATPPHFMPGAHHPPPPGYAAAAPLPEQYRLLLAGGSSGVGEVDLPPTPLQPPPPPPPPPPQQQQPPGMESFAFFDTAFGGGAGGGGQGRWPRQETLTLLEVRSRLDSKFREAAHKGPLWDEVSRIMAEEHGYERSGKKCREKLENLYKYYKKTKEGKAGRQDGKHYRFFRQLEALYGGSSCNASTEIHQPYAKPAFIASHLTPSRQVKLSAAYHTSLSNSPSGFSESSSSDDNGDDDDEDEDEELLKMGGKSWRSKVAELIDAQINRFVEVQEAWMNEMLQTLEHMEQARISREEDWRRQEAARFDRECSIWAGERAWIEARDAAIIQALEKISHRRTQQQEQQLRGREEDESSPSPESCWHGQFTANGDGDPTARTWAESETASLIKIRSGLEAEFQREGGGRGCSDAALWEHVSATMSCLGYTRSAMRCKERWEDLNRLSSTSKSAPMNCCGKKRRKNSKMTTSKLQENSCSERSGGGDEEEQRSDLVGLGIGDEGTASHSSYVNGVDDESSFLFSVGQDEGCLWENNGVRNGRGDGS